ncbi:MAG: hypothetical protein GXP18_02380, partial [Gammaproteobacteria bacterium]|nr:hypothetical protein [Gammaproteobacteria bacterium]
TKQSCKFPVIGDVGRQHNSLTNPVRGMDVQKRNIRRDFGLTWKSRLGEARVRAAALGPRFSREQIASLKSEVSSVDVSSPEISSCPCWAYTKVCTWIQKSLAKKSQPSFFEPVIQTLYFKGKYT